MRMSKKWPRNTSSRGHNLEGIPCDPDIRMIRTSLAMVEGQKELQLFKETILMHSTIANLAHNVEEDLEEEELTEEVAISIQIALEAAPSHAMNTRKNIDLYFN